MSQRTGFGIWAAAAAGCTGGAVAFTVASSRSSAPDSQFGEIGAALLISAVLIAWGGISAVRARRPEAATRRPSEAWPVAVCLVLGATLFGLGITFGDALDLLLQYAILAAWLAVAGRLLWVTGRWGSMKAILVAISTLWIVTVPVVAWAVADALLHPLPAGWVDPGGGMDTISVDRNDDPIWILTGFVGFALLVFTAQLIALTIGWLMRTAPQRFRADRRLG